MAVAAWGVEENGELWDCAFQTRKEALHELASAMCDLGNKGDKDPGADREWSARIVRVTIEKQS